MTNENELEEMREQLQLQSDVCNLLKSRKERIDALESAIREFIEIDKIYDEEDAKYEVSEQTKERFTSAYVNLRNIMENKS